MFYFHTCKTTSGRRFVEQNAPFLSRANGPKKWQWLSQGYYFWTDVDYFAHIWGRDSYNNDYAIVRCQITINSDIVLDLAANVEHSLYFKGLAEAYQKKIQKVNPNEIPTVSTVIEHYRKAAEKNKEIFPFEAIRAVDCSPTAPKLKFAPDAMGFMTTIPRLQFCLFQSSRNAITSKEIYHFS
ncbi:MULTISPECIES: hypothetical protein [Enterobacteriaceae]|uniref:hypothetical protein n=1 Tax=Enterobacteriaceae TaxID=543 RepID=UPI000FC9FD90|nr:hypothetical protein [Enterobacter roggenkampii]